MPVNITIRNVPDEVRDELAARAARSGRSLQEFLSAEFVRIASTPSAAEASGRARLDASLNPALTADEIVVAMLASSSEIGDRIAVRLADATLLAPHLLPTEVDSALRALEWGGRISPARADAARGLFAQFPIDLWPWHLLADRAWQLRANATTYDGGYIALAEVTNATLVTFDARLGNVSEVTAGVEVIA